MNYVSAISHALSYHLRSNWYILLIGISLAVAINVYLDPARLRSFLNRRAGLSIPGAVAFGALTPLCACGTMAVLVSMFASVMPWGAVMAFLVASPLASPSDFLFQTAFLGSRFALTMLTSAVALGLLGGLTAYTLERKTSFFTGQLRLATADAARDTEGEHSALSTQHSATEKSSGGGGCCGDSHQPLSSHQLPAASRQPGEHSAFSTQHSAIEISPTSVDCCTTALLAEHKRQETDDKRQPSQMSCCGDSHQPPAASRQPEEHSAFSSQHSAPENTLGGGGCCTPTALPEHKRQATDDKRQPPRTSCCGEQSRAVSISDKLKLKELGKAFWDLGVKRILLYFVLFISIGTVVEMLIPSSWIYSAFGGGKAHSIPLSASIGLPLYVSSSSALPILRSFINAGAGEGAILAFLIAGKGTSLPVMLGMSTFLKPKSIALYALFVFGGSICAGYLYELALALLA